jgi:GT2 family glycosyltransferase
MDAASSLSESPLVSVVILNYKRRDALRRVLDSVRTQEYANREIILVDNNSGDEIRPFIEDYAPEVELIELPENRGACGGRNAGIVRTRGQIVITLDNDIFLESAFELTKVVNAFRSRPDIHILAFFLGEADTGAVRSREWCHPRSMADFSSTEFETNYFVEGAAAYRRELFETVGKYYEPIFLGNEGHDLALRALDHGFRILYAPQIRARHLMSLDTRSSERTIYMYTRNYIWISYKDFELVEGVRFLILKLAMMLYFSVRVRHLPAFFRGIKDGLKGLPHIHSERTPISRSTASYIAELDSNRPAWRVRLARHRTGPQI